MIKRLLTIAAFVSMATSAVSQCTIAPITTPGIYPDTTTNLPAATAGTAYGTDIQVRVFEDTVSSGVTVDVSDITINSVVGLPAGFTYSCNPANCVFPGGGNGCIWLSGNPTAGQAGTYNLTVNVTLHGVIFGSIPVSQASTVNGYRIVINAAPAPTPEFSSNDARVCATQSVSFTNLTTGGATSYLWTFPGGTPATSTSANPSVQYLVKGSYDVTLEATNANGTNTITKPAFVLIDSLSVAAVAPGGNNTICKGQSILLSSQSTHPSFTYQWEKNNVNIPNATSATFSATQQATYRVKVINGLGCTKRSANNTVFTSQPVAPITANGPTTFCSGDNVQLQTAGSLTNTFQWLRNNNPIAGANSPLYTASSYGGYRVRVTDQLGCTNTSAAIYLNVRQNPLVAISPIGPIQLCIGDNVNLSVPFESGVSYQWIFNNSAPIGTGNVLNVSSGGFYKMSAIHMGTNCVNESANTHVIMVNCRQAGYNSNMPEGRFSFTMNPNPSNDRSTVYFELPEAGNISVEVFDMTGRKFSSVLNSTMEAGMHEVSLNTANFPSGVYFVSVVAGADKQTIKLVVDHQ